MFDFDDSVQLTDYCMTIANLSYDVMIIIQAGPLYVARKFSKNNVTPTCLLYFKLRDDFSID